MFQKINSQSFVIEKCVLQNTAKPTATTNCPICKDIMIQHACVFKFSCNDYEVAIAFVSFKSL